RSLASRADRRTRRPPRVGHGRGRIGFHVPRDRCSGLGPRGPGRRARGTSTGQPRWAALRGPAPRAHRTQAALARRWRPSPDTLPVHSAAMPRPRCGAERGVGETLAAITGGREAGTAARHERLAATVACKAAIKAGDVLSPSEMRALFVALRDTTLPAHDVH